MDYEERNEQSGPYRHFRNSLDLGMGVFYVIIGIIIMSVKSFGSIELSVISARILGALMALYGLFRIYRGVMQTLRMKRRRNTQRNFRGPDHTTQG